MAPTPEITEEEQEIEAREANMSRYRREWAEGIMIEFVRIFE
jgi:hypothetical protein